MTDAQSSSGSSGDVMNAQLDSPPVESRPLMRFLAFGVVVVLGASLLGIRLFALQLGSGTKFTALAGANMTVKEDIPSTRGLITDRNGVPLVTNVASYSVRILPADLPESRRDDVVATLAKLLGMSAADINIAIDSNPGSRFDLVRIASDVDPNVASFIAESNQELPGVQIVADTRREYNLGTLVSQVVGYTGPVDAAEIASLKAQGYQPADLIGRAGIEAAYEQQLRGVYGLETVERDATGRALQVLQVDQPPISGDSLQLSIDVTEQKYAQQALQWGMKAAGLKGGVVIVENPQTGEILAMVSLPTYDDNQFAQGITNKQYQALLDNPAKPLLNHAISEQYPPGSTYKLVTASAGLADNKITPATLIHTAGFLRLGGSTFHDWNPSGFGLCNLYCGYGNSSDTYFYQVAARVGIDRLGYWAKRYGFGAPSGIDLPGEAAGTIPTNDWKLQTLGAPIYPGEVYLAGIGQGYDVVTPLQLLNAYCALANGGTLYEPRIVRNVIGPDGSTVQAFKPVVLRKVGLASSILTTMRHAARYAVVIRHTWNLVDLPIVVAGKTGTAEFGLPDAQGNLPYHTWFVAFVPKDPQVTASDPYGYKAVERTDSQLAVLVFAYDAQTKGNAALEIAMEYLQLHFHIKHDYRLPNLLQRVSNVPVIN
jgi:penicillin-binding protein 2